MKKILAVHQTVLGQRGNHNETHRAEIPARVHLRRIARRAPADHRRGGLRNGSRRNRRAEAIAVRSGFRADDHRQEPARQARHSPGQRQQLLLRRQSWPTFRNFTEHTLNSRLAEINGKLVEQVYRAGTPDGKIPPGLYAEYLAKANSIPRESARLSPSPRKPKPSAT